MADLTFADNDEAETATLQFLDDKGDPTEPASVPQWVSDDNGNVITLDVASDGLSATATPVAPGTAHVTVTVNDEEGVAVTGQSTVIVTGGDVNSLSVVWTPITPVPVTSPTDAQISPNVPAAPETWTASPSTTPGAAVGQAGAVTVDSGAEDDSEGFSEPQLVPADNDGNPVPLSAGTATPSTSAATTPASTPVSSVVASSASTAPVAGSAVTDGGTVPAPVGTPSAPASAGQPETSTASPLNAGAPANAAGLTDSAPASDDKSDSADKSTPA